MTGLPTTPGFWPDYYMCRHSNIVETINRMLKDHTSDFPNTACGGFEIERNGDFVKIKPIILRRDNGY